MLELVLADRTRVPLVDDMTIGRAPGSTVRLDDPAVSRRQARISVAGGEVLLEDAGSSYGTWLDGRRLDGREPLRDGSRIRIGDLELVVERHRDDGEAGRTVVVPAESSLAAPVTGSFGTHPKVRSGYALKRLAASEGKRRWILRDLESDRFLRMSDADAKLLALLDGRHSLADLVSEAEQGGAEAGPARLARLLSELADRGLLAGVAGAETAGPAHGFVQRLAVPREKTWAGAGRVFDRMYWHGGSRLFTRPALAAIAVLAIAGLAVFPYLVVGRYGTPFVVAQKVGVGALIFLVGRLAVVVVHETAHGLTMASYGRRGPPRRSQGAAHLPVRVRGHVRGVVRAEAPADSDQRGWADVRPDAGRAVLAWLSGPPRRSHPGHPLPARLRRVRRGVLQPQPVRRA
jgi:putative peptide zinc metalloprotease protein